jgi:hypothetical protein
MSARDRLIFCPYGFGIEQMHRCKNGTIVAQIVYAYDPDGTGAIIAHAYKPVTSQLRSAADDRKTIAVFDTVQDACNAGKHALYPANRILKGQFIIQCNETLVHQASLLDEVCGGTQAAPFGYLAL